MVSCDSGIWVQWDAIVLPPTQTTISARSATLNILYKANNLRDIFIFWKIAYSFEYYGL